MPKTRLLRSIVQLARDVAAAEARGVEVERLDDERRAAAPKVSRRAVIAGAGAAAGALVLPRRAGAAGQPRIAIVGGGISGLSAALTLADAGLGSTVYEASGRVGGRMYSNTTYWDQGQVSEWGGELIDSGHKTVRTLAKRFNLPLADLAGAQPNGSEDTYYFDGQYYPRAQAVNDFKPVHHALSVDLQGAGYPTLYDSFTSIGQALDNMSVYDWIDSRVPGGHASPMGQLLDTAYAIEYGSDTTGQSSLNLVYLLAFQAMPGNFSIFGLSDERYHIIGGNQQLPLAIAAALGNVRTGWRLLAIAKTAAGAVQLTFSTSSGTQVVTADYAILTLPFAVLRNLNYTQAGFDALKDLAIQQLGRGRNGKLQLQFTSRLWDGTGAWPGTGNGNSYADTGYQNTWDVTRAQGGSDGILVDYTGGSVTLAMNTQVPWGTIASKGVPDDARRFLTQIEPVYPGISARWNGRATSSLPHLDPNLQLSYSYWKVGQYTSFSGYERAPQGNIFFGGEHTSIDFQGFMEGGASEGVRAANEVMTAIGVK